MGVDRGEVWLYMAGCVFTPNHVCFVESVGWVGMHELPRGKESAQALHGSEPDRIGMCGVGVRAVVGTRVQQPRRSCG